MAHGGDLFAIGDGVPSEQNFEIAFRGYKQDQVDNFVRLLETDLATVSAERDEAYAQLQALTTQVHQLQLELVESRQRITGPTTITYTFVLQPGNTVPPGTWTFAAQMGTTGVVHNVHGDTFTLNYTSGGQSFTQSGAF